MSCGQIQSVKAHVSMYSNYEKYNSYKLLRVGLILGQIVYIKGICFVITHLAAEL